MINAIIRAQQGLQPPMGSGKCVDRMTVQDAARLPCRDLLPWRHHIPAIRTLRLPRYGTKLPGDTGGLIGFVMVRKRRQHQQIQFRIWIENSVAKKNIRAAKKGVYWIMFRKLIVPAMLSASLLGLAGCGYSPGQRALSGGAIGAGGGAIVGAATGMGAGTGALIGAGAGALTGAATTHNQLNLGN